MPTLHIRHPDGTEEQLPLDRELTVGRGEGNDLVLTEGGVSRRHARLFVEGKNVWVEDLGSANGTWLEGSRVESPAVLEPERVLEVGEYELTLLPDSVRGRRQSPERTPQGLKRDTRADPVRLPEGRVARGPDAAAVPARRAVPSLRGTSGPWAGQRYPLTALTSVGRSRGVDIRLDDDSVSRRHAELEVTDEGVLVRDLDSANGTQLNGEPLEEEQLLESGDRLTFGVVELIFEDPSQPERPPSVRQRSGANKGEGGGRAFLRIALAALGTLVVIGLVWGFLPTLGASILPREAPGAMSPVAEGSPEVELETHLSQCRSFSAVDLQDPDWEKAESACGRALDIDPIHDEANALNRKVKLEKSAWQTYEKAEKAMSRLREEEALELYRQLPADSLYYRRAKQRVKVAIESVKRRAGEDCRKYARSRAWTAALPRCELYMTIACPSMPEEALYPPARHVLKLKGRLRRGEWRPKDAMYRRFLEVRSRVLPRSTPPWRCTPSPLYQEDGFKEEDPDEGVRRALKARYEEPALRQALLLYWEGNMTDALALLSRLRDDVQKVRAHAEADELRKDIAAAQNLFKSGQTALGVEDLERAAKTFTEVLQIDERLMKGEAKTFPSLYRRNIEQDLAAASYRKGRYWAERQDARRGCAVWKIGFSFYQGNTDLNRAAHYCSTLAGGALEKAQTCTQLAEVLELAVPGDGLEAKVNARKAELNCP